MTEVSIIYLELQNLQFMIHFRASVKKLTSLKFRWVTTPPYKQYMCTKINIVLIIIITTESYGRNKMF